MSEPHDPRRDGLFRSYLQGEATLGDVYEFTREELYEICAQGRTLFESGQVEKAQRVFEGLTALEPYNADFHVGLGAVYQRQHDLDRALIEYDRAVSLNELDVAARTNRAEVLLERGEVERAVADLARVAALDPEGSNPHGQRALALAAALQQQLEGSGATEETS